MNAIWINHISKYKYTPQAVTSAQKIIEIKIQRRKFLMKKYKTIISLPSTKDLTSIQRVLLYEARAGKYFWAGFSPLLPSWRNFKGRKAKSSDIANRLLDIGYHHATNTVIGILNKYDISPTLGVMHIAHASNSAPLAYDLVEMFRADIVEAEALRFLRLKKKPMVQLQQKDIAIFINRINNRIDRKYFLKEFHQCRSYAYYMELQILKFIKSVNHKEVFSPLHLPYRHENRCLESKNIDIIS